ncbi:hypothetical protein ILUMI_05977 [Ignelater luminosus]|uniref:Uncharacterized protein n=1 Tax=Ignelater luminosus TaxID=2038154 RepID=A0A8K0GI71_IGNLU|nr:hypothetical protein ILUMI_05977 [Ignelater luminosus]
MKYYPRVPHKENGASVRFTNLFRKRIEEICSFASRMLDFVIRIAKLFRDPTILPALYYGFVRSRLGHACVLESLLKRRAKCRAEFLAKLVNNKIDSPELFLSSMRDLPVRSKLLQREPTPNSASHLPYD